MIGPLRSFELRGLEEVASILLIISDAIELPFASVRDPPFMHKHPDSELHQTTSLTPQPSTSTSHTTTAMVRGSRQHNVDL